MWGSHTISLALNVTVFGQITLKLKITVKLIILNIQFSVFNV